MTAGIFAQAQPKYAALRIATFPFDATAEVKRGPLVSHYSRIGLPASKEMARRFPDAPGLAAMAGARNRLTVIDIDAKGSEGERLLADVQRQFGESKIVVRTGSGGFHAYYRHNGEGRKIRPDPSRPIDLIGGGAVVLPPTRGFRGNYEIIEGMVDDLASLTAIQRSTPEKQPFRAMVSHSGRNNALFSALCEEARQLPATLEVFIQRAFELNNQFGEPMLESRVIKTAKSVFKYLETGELRSGNYGAWFKRDQVQGLVGDPYLFALLAWLKAQNGPDAVFWIANGLAAAHLGWSVPQLRHTRKRAERGKWIELVEKAAKGRNALWRWGPTARVLGVQNSTPYPQ